MRLDPLERGLRELSIKYSRAQNGPWSHQEPSDTVESVKAKIKDMSGITEDFWLRYDGKQMDEVGGRTLADYGIHDPATEMEIFVRGLMGNTRTLWVKPSDTVKSVKVKL
ncbi:uncharacterized protein LOC127785929 [Oryza glaberrima]|uniref:uncharacterized protein LOC127785929 n=1 Tax=Oryza glaberrima TaxID=4538 RepID=UPI00224BE86E|nr:uncharacterized protein LOC127785929 [Oryza glaberrima]